MARIPSPRRPSALPALRRTRVPPALSRGAETLAGAPILDEVAGDLGVVLWRSLRNVALWAATPAGYRGALFAGDAAAARENDLSRLAVDAELVAPLSVIVRLLESPAGMDMARVVNACRRVAMWAEQHGYLATALEWAQAAAQAAPQSAGLAYAVGRLARRRAEYDRAESWYARAIVQARRARDWRTYASAYSGLGNMAVQKGNFPWAKRAHARCLKAALRHGLSDLAGSAYHNLFVTEIETGAGLEADVLAERAFRQFGPNHDQLPRLGYDVAYHWMLEGLFEQALRVGLALERRFETPAECAVAISMVARSAGGMGDRAAFHDARARLDALLSDGCAEETAARSLLGVAYGAASLSDWPLAETYGERALHLANERREGRVVLAAESALDLVRTRSAAAAPADRSGAAALADELVAALGGGGALVPA
jgi:tetratricopeptide (TPR) repeat protein